MLGEFWETGTPMTARVSRPILRSTCFPMNARVALPFPVLDTFFVFRVLFLDTHPVGVRYSLQRPSGQAVVSGVLPSPSPPVHAFIFIAHTG